MSETLRLELKPFGVNVITACVGTVKSRFHQNEHIHLPEGSIFEPAREEIQKVADGTLYKDEPVDVFVNKFIKRILSGASGRLYEGGMAGMTYLASNYAPAMILVSARGCAYLVCLLGAEQVFRIELFPTAGALTACTPPKRAAVEAGRCAPKDHPLAMHDRSEPRSIRGT